LGLVGSVASAARTEAREVRTGRKSGDRLKSRALAIRWRSPAGVTRGIGGQDHERKGREGVTTVFGGRPEGTESSRGDRGVGRRKTSVGDQRIGAWIKALETGAREPAQAGQLGCRGANRKVRRARTGDEAGRLGIGENPWRVNLGRGSGMKQAREVQRGVSRRECAKHCGRNVDRNWEACRWVDSLCSCREGDRDPMEGARRLRPAGGCEAATDSGEEAKLRRGWTRARKWTGDGVARNTAQAAWKQEGHGGIELTREARYDSAYKTL